MKGTVIVNEWQLTGTSGLSGEEWSTACEAGKLGECSIINKIYSCEEKKSINK
jgi:hypothetical protein